MSVFILVLRFFIAYIFIVSGYSKLKDLNIFTQAVDSYRILPQIIIRPFSLALPWFELLLGIAVGIGLYVRVSSVMLVLLLCMFAIALSINIFRGRNIDCGCFGKKRPQKINWNLVARDGILIFILVAIYFLDDGSITVNNLISFINLS